jgi:Putative RNA methylase family UPF0020
MSASLQDHHEYLTLLPRGLHQIIRSMIYEAFEEEYGPLRFQKHTATSTYSNPRSGYFLNIEFIQDDYLLSKSGISNDEALLKRGREEVIRSEQAKQEKGKKTVSSSTLLSSIVGTVADKSLGTDISVGYRPCLGPYDSKDMLKAAIETSREDCWAVPGQLTGIVWSILTVSNNIPPSFVANKLRCIGPLLALVVVLQPSNTKERDKPTDHDASIQSVMSIPSQALSSLVLQHVKQDQQQSNGCHVTDHVNPSVDSGTVRTTRHEPFFQPHQTLAESVVSLRHEQEKAPEAYDCAFDRALDLWSRHVQECWMPGLANEQRCPQPTSSFTASGNTPLYLEERSLEASPNLANISPELAKAALHYRLSCVRPDPIGSDGAAAATADQDSSRRRPRQRLYKNQWRYKRGELLNEIAIDMVPSKYTSSVQSSSTAAGSPTRVDFAGQANGRADDNPQSKDGGWCVDLKNFDLEVVVIVRPGAMAVGLSLRNYNNRIPHVFARMVRSNSRSPTLEETTTQADDRGAMPQSTALPALSFASGGIPPDIAPPYIAGTSIPGLVRLRPTTAQVLWRLAGPFDPGDVIVDPCAGIGTIPNEGTMLPSWRRAQDGGEAIFCSSRVLTFGGDLALCPSGLGPVGAEYARKIRRLRAKPNQSTPPYASIGSSVSDLFAWDAANIPMRTASADAIISDLPFGQQCLSSWKLNFFLPCLMTECARLLRPTTGRMVLLCGSYLPVLQALVQVNEWNCTTRNNGERIDGPPAGEVWIFPCQAVFPVNIGGLLAWIVQIQRGPAPLRPSLLQSHGVRVQRLAEQRMNVARHRKSALNKSVQS